MPEIIARTVVMLAVPVVATAMAYTTVKIYTKLYGPIEIRIVD